ncbi:cubilin-like [Haliotis asinina]|uniref:cubilin-like n=1 Tax=Haliotis asinina TaxID=109174 RepID=UPI0035327BAB
MSSFTVTLKDYQLMPVFHVSFRRRQGVIMNVPCFVRICICVLLYGALISGACDVTLHAEREPLNFTSPNYPSNYANNENCFWDIYPATRGYQVVLEMVYSSIEYSSTCAYDVLIIDVINDGNHTKASSRRICGGSRWNMLIQEDQHFHVVFTTDGSRTSSGFLIRYYERNGTETCGVPLVATSVGKTFNSPGYPNIYRLSQTCTWTITTEHQNQTIQLDTLDSGLQNSSSGGTCGGDHVTVYNGQYSTTESYQLGTFCGNERPVFNSGVNSLRVELRADSLQVYKGFKMLYKAVPATTCNLTLPAVNSPMMIVSPGYPNNYVNGLDCQWTINALIGKTVTVRVLSLDLENVPSCVNDYLLFKDGTATDARQMAKICEQTYTPIVSSSNHMTIIFHSDSSVTGGGFRLQYTSATDCGLSDLSASSVLWKYLTSLGYPSNYDNNVNCEWKITAPYYYKIKVEIAHMWLEYSSLCSSDYLAFRDGPSYWSRQLGKYCGVRSNKQIVSTGPYMTITFHTNSLITRPGFNLKYIAGKFPTTTTITTTTTTTTTTERPHASNCGSSMHSAIKYSWKYLASPGYPDYNYNNNIYCQWTISAPVGYKVKVEVQTMSLEYDPSCSRDYVLFRDGSSSYSTRLGKYCDDVTGYIVSSSNAMTITFRTDSSVTDRGFSLKYIARTKACGEDDTISYEAKYIESPNYPLSYPNNADCEWTISTSIDGYVIHVEVVSFNLEYDSTCSYDYVQLYDVVTSFESPIGRWCGTDGPNTQTTGQTMKVKFLSDGSTSRSGFKLSFTAGEPTYSSVAALNIGAIVGGVFGGITVVGVAVCCCCGLCSRKKSSPNDQRQRNRPREGIVSFINVPSYPQTPPTAPTAPAVLPFMSAPPPSYNDVVKNDPPPYCQVVPLSDVQPVVTSSPSGASEDQGIDNPVGPNRSGERFTLCCSLFKFCSLELYQSRLTVTLRVYQLMSGFRVSSRQRQDVIMNIPCFVGICVLLYGTLVSGACDVTLHAEREPLNFTSPNYPGNYTNNENCYWDIYPATRGYRVVLEMVYSSIEYSSTCAYDVLTIDVLNDGNQTQAPSRRICGESRWNILIQEDQHFHIVFTTDGSRTSSGFLIRYYEKIGAGNCGVPLVATSVGKTFNSPGYPNTYFLSQTCRWTITTEHQNQTIQLVTVDSVLQSSSSGGTCDRDYVTVYNGQYGIIGSNQLGTFCGNDRPVFNSGVNSLRVELQTDSSQNYKGFKMLYKAVPATTCNLTLTAVNSPMMIISPGYPNNYVNGLDCQWTIHAPIGGNITVKVLSLDLENVPSCVNDYLLFKDGTTTNARQLAKICEQRSTPIVSSSNHMTIMFHSDSSLTGGGFRLQYTSERPHASNCGSSMLSASKYSWRYLSSPGYPYYNYNNNIYCKWTISAPVGYKVKVEVQTMSLEYDSSCSRDYVLFRDGSSSYGTRLGKYCDDVSGYIVSSSNAMTITFRTDSSVTDRGFSLKYIAWTQACGKDDTISYETKYIESPNYPLSYPNDADCEWTISTSIDGYVIHVEAVFFNLEYDSTCSYDYVQLYDVVTSYESSIGRWCGTDGPNRQTTGQTMKVKFHSDGSTSRSGFKLSFTAGEPTTYSSVAALNIGAIVGGVFGGITVVGVAVCCCCGLCSRKKSSPNDQRQRNRSREGIVSFINVPNYPQTPPTAPTAPAVLPFMSLPPPTYNDVVKNDPPPYCQVVPLSDVQPVVTSSPSGASEDQGIDNPAGPNRSGERFT